MKRDVPDIVIEQLFLDEIDPRLKEELLKEPTVLERIEALKASNAEILAAYPPQEFRRRIASRLEIAREAEERVNGAREIDAAQTRSMPGATNRAGHLGKKIVRMVQWKGFVPVLAAAAAIALIVGVVPLLMRGGVRPNESPLVRIKGAEPVLHVYRETKSGIERLTNGSRAGAHDLLQLSYIAYGARFGMIFSVDGSGTVTLHFPEHASEAALLESEGEVALPHAYELDNAPRYERFYLVTSATEFPVNQILSIARRAVTSGRLSSIAFPPEFHVATFTVDKETKR